DAYSNTKVNATSTDVYWRITDGTNAIQSYTLKQDDEWHPISSAPFLASETGNCIEIVSEPNFTGAVSVTQANIKQNFQFAQLAYLNPQTGWTPLGVNEFTASNTAPEKGVSNEDEHWCKREGSDLIVKGTYEQVSTSGSTDGLGAYF